MTDHRMPAILIRTYISGYEYSFEIKKPFIDDPLQFSIAYVQGREDGIKALRLTNLLTKS